MTRAADALCRLFDETRSMDLECGALYHAAHGLILYRERLFGPMAPFVPAAGGDAAVATDEAPAADGAAPAADSAATPDAGNATETAATSDDSSTPSGTTQP